MVCLVTLIASILNLAPVLRGIRSVHRAGTIVSVFLLLLFPSLVLGQESPQTSSLAPPTLEFASVKPSNPLTQGHRFRVSGHRFEATNTSLLDLISFAFGLHATQIIGAPDWLRSDKFDLTLQATAERQMDEVLWTSLLQRYLIESLKLSFHRDTRDLPLYALAIGQSSSGLALSTRDPKTLPELAITLGARNAANANLATISATNATVGDLASLLQRVVLEWPVVDRTGLTGHYDFALTWTPDGAQFGDLRARTPAPLDVPNAPPYLTTALQQQTGLSLDLVVAPLQVLAIDFIEEPIENGTTAARLKDGRLPGRIWRPWHQSPWFTFSTEINPLLVTNDLY